MSSALLIDIGSTYTKVTLMNLEEIKIIGRSQAYTTVENDVRIGLEEALKDIPHWEKADYKLACSSAAGGLKIIAIGLVPDLTAEAARRAALGAGSKVLKTYSYQLTESETREIEESKPDIILLAGGTDGGNRENILHNAERIANSSLQCPVIVAGNKNAAEEVMKKLKMANKEVYITENVMPELEKLNIEPARKKIRELFLERIIKAKGLNRVNEIIDSLIMPTPAAVLKGAELLADGTGQEKGLGELMVIDIGGATTDVHSIASGRPQKGNINWRGLEEPYVKRTVEGDLGMRYSAPSLYTAVGSVNFQQQLREKGILLEEDEVSAYIGRLHKEVNYIPVTSEGVVFDNLLAWNGVKIAVSRHVGRLKTVYTPVGAMSIQEGKDLTNLNYVIGTGGIIVNNDNPADILTGALYKNQENPEVLAPMEPQFMVDEKYILAAAGLLAGYEPETSIKFMKKHLKETEVEGVR